MTASIEPSTPEQHYHQALTADHARRGIRTIPELQLESSREILSAVKLLDVLEADDRPSFAIRVQPALPQDVDAPLDLSYHNAAFANTNGLLEKVTGRLDAASIFAEHDQPQQAFRRWLRDVVDESDFARRGNAYMFNGLIWTTVIIEDHKLVSGLYASLLWPEAQPSKHHENILQKPKNMPVQGRAPLVPSTPSSQNSAKKRPPVASPGMMHGPYDVTLPNPPESILSDHIKHFRSTDWSLTPLGLMLSWPPELRNVVNLCLNDTHPCVLFWGDDLTMIYNAAYVQLIGIMHPHAMGQSARTVASDYWHTFQPLVDHINATGQSVRDDEIPIFVDRLGFLEETYWSFQFIPVLDSNGHVAGYYHPLFETTK
jgi:hypothetical protein